MVPILEPYEGDVPSPRIFFKASARIMTQSLRRSIRDAALVSEHVKLEIMGEEFIFGTTRNNVLNEIIGVVLILSFLMAAFSKEKQEDELIAKIRLESLVWATYVNYAVLLFSMIFIYGISFLWVMIFNMFTILLFFIIRFNWQVHKLNKSMGNEE
jgi:Ca2+-dependent lipid-binding protein